jgi:hypothetical protein
LRDILGAHCAVAYGGERAFDDIGREVVEGQQRVAILDQALDRLLVFDASVLDKGVLKAASEDPALRL